MKTQDKKRKNANFAAYFLDYVKRIRIYNNYPKPLKDFVYFKQHQKQN